MKIISEIYIKNFRSLRNTEIKSLEDFSVLVGLNNSGKSNVLRALNLFFYNQPEPNIDLDFNKDHHFTKEHRKKEIVISVGFSLPDDFKFQKTLKGVEELLGRNFYLIKRWIFETLPTADILLQRKGEKQFKLNSEEKEKALAFLRLINYRYIPNHIHPSDIISKEFGNIKQVLLRKLGRVGGEQRKNLEKIFSEIERHSSHLIQPISEGLEYPQIEVMETQLVSPKRLEDLLFSFIFQVKVSKDRLLPAILQGSGIQSHLMYRLLHLVDTSFGQQFGWRQATIWATEELESSMHTSLEAIVANFFRDSSTNEGNRLQIICSTHSDIFIQHALNGAFLTLKDGSTISQIMEPIELVKKSSMEGITRYVHPLLFHPLEPLIIVEGITDEIILKKALRELGLNIQAHIYPLSILTDSEQTGNGVEKIIKYLNDNRQIIGRRDKKAPLIVVVDWSVNNDKKKDIEKSISIHTKSVCYKFNENHSNPELGRKFTGIERYLSTNLIRNGEEKGFFKLTRPSQGDFPLDVDREVLKQSKRKFAEFIKLNGAKEDFKSLEQPLKEIIDLCSGCNPLLL